MVPKAMFFTHGVGVHKDKLTSFELALRKAGCSHVNLVQVSSIFPPHCEEVSRKSGEKRLPPGQVTFCVLARQDTKEPGRVICSSIGLSRTENPNEYGYLSEHHGYGQEDKQAGDYAEDLAATMLATTLGFDLDPNKDWNSFKDEYYAMQNGDPMRTITTKSVVQTAKGDEQGRWTTVVSLGIFVF